MRQQRPIRCMAGMAFDGSRFLLICDASNGEDSWNTWHPTVVDADAQAHRWLGIRPCDWEPLSHAQENDEQKHQEER